jgi:hypothetical protein
MCGLVAIIGNLGAGDKDVFKDLLLMSRLRGEDSTGFFSIPTSTNEPKVAKVVGTPDELFATVAWDRLSAFQSRGLIGHTRKATVGGISRSTAHPFQYGHITGVHNGTLRNWRDLPTEIQATDSGTLYKALSEEEPEDVFPQVNGAYACIWWNNDEQMLHVIRNSERTLHYAFSENGEKMYLASEAWMITVTCDRNDVKLMNLTPKAEYAHRTLPVDPDRLGRVRPGVTSKTALVIQPDTVVKGGTNLPKKDVPFRQQYPFGGSHVHTPSQKAAATPPSSTPASTVTVDASSSTKNSSSDKPSSDASSSATTVTPPSKPLLTAPVSNKSTGSVEQGPTIEELNDKVVDLFQDRKKVNDPFSPDVLAGNGGLLFSAEEYEQLVDPNCVWCQKPHSFKELQTGFLGTWVEDDKYICSGCMVSQTGAASC